MQTIDFDMNSKIKAFDLDGVKMIFNSREHSWHHKWFSESEENKSYFVQQFTKPQSYYEYDLVA